MIGAAEIAAKPEFLFIAMSGHRRANRTHQNNRHELRRLHQHGDIGGKTTRSSTPQTIAGVDDVKVSLPAGEATVKYDERLTSLDALKSVIKGAGYGVDVPNVSHKQATKSGCCG